MPTFQCTFGGLHWREDGDPDGPPLVFANSLGTDLHLWDLLLPYLPLGHRIIRYDLRGHGLSDGPDGPYTMDALAGDCAALLDHLGMRDAVLVGCSIGGMIGQILAARRPDLIKQLVLCTSAARMGDAAMWQHRIAEVKADGLGPMSDAILARWFSKDFRAQNDTSVWRAMVERTSVAGYAGCCHALANADLTLSSGALTLPVLAISGGADLACPPARVRATATSIPMARYHQIDGVGHLPSIEAPTELGQLISDFLDEVQNDRS